MLAVDLIPLNSSRISCIYFSCLVDLLLSLIPCLIFLPMSISLAPCLFCPLIRLSMRAESSWSLLSIVSSLRAAVTAVGCSSISVSQFVPSLSLRVAVQVFPFHRLPMQSSSCAAQSISDSLCVPAVVVIVCFRSNISDSPYAAASCLPGDFLMSRDLHVAPLMQGISRILYLCRDHLSVFCFPILLSMVRMGIENAHLQICVTWEVNHVVRLSVSEVPSVSPVNYHVVQLFLFHTWGSGSVFSVFFECCIECHIVLDHQTLLHPKSLVCWMVPLCVLQRSLVQSLSQFQAER